MSGKYRAFNIFGDLEAEGDSMSELLDAEWNSEKVAGERDELKSKLGLLAGRWLLQATEHRRAADKIGTYVPSAEYHLHDVSSECLTKCAEELVTIVHGGDEK